MAKPQREDAEDNDLTEDDDLSASEETDDEEEETVAPPAAEEDDDLATDDEVKQWIADVTDTPEIKAVIRHTAREVAKRSTDRAVAEVREALETDFAKRLEKVTKLLEDGSITESEANKRAQLAAEAAVKAERRRSKLPDLDTTDDTEEDNDDNKDQEKVAAERRAAADAEQKRIQDEREARIKQRELQAYMREALADEDKAKIITEMIEVRPGMSENDIDDLIEMSKEVRERVRKQIISELRKQGWKSPRELRAAQEPEEDEEEDATEETGPPARDAKTDSLTKKRRLELRSRFGYSKEKTASPR